MKCPLCHQSLISDKNGHIPHGWQDSQPLRQCTHHIHRLIYENAIVLVSTIEVSNALQYLALLLKHGDSSITLQ